MTIDIIREQIAKKKTILPEQGILVFDIDDTLIDCRHRKKLVIEDFVKAQGEDHSYTDSHLKELQSMETARVRFRIKECLDELAIVSPKLEKDLFKFWLDNYFTYPYLVKDIAFPGALDFVKSYLEEDVKIIYLTGRDEPGMGEGTRQSLKDLGFPMEEADCELMLKPDPEQSDIDFKKQALKDIAAMGSVIAFFENEIRNLNMMGEIFPQSLLIWRDTLQSPEQPEPDPRIQTLKQFS